MKHLLKREYIYQFILIILLILLSSIDRHHPHFHFHELVFFLNYVIAASIINYVLLPRFFYKKRILLFWIYTIIVISMSVSVEEFFLEQIYFPDTRGGYFDIMDSLYDIIPTIAILVGFKFAWDATQKENKINQLDKVILESELQFLNSQISPHFLFNNLNNIYSFALEKSNKTEELILELSSVLRYMLYDCKEKRVEVNKELEYIEKYIHLYQIQLEDRGNIKFSKEFTNCKGNISPLIIIVFIENAFHVESNR